MMQFKRIARITADLKMAISSLTKISRTLLRRVKAFLKSSKVFSSPAMYCLKSSIWCYKALDRFVAPNLARGLIKIALTISLKYLVMIS